MHGQPVLLGDLLRAQVLLHREREVRAALHGRVVREDHALAALDDADPGHDPGRRRLAVVELPRGERAELEERRARIDEPVDPLARRSASRASGAARAPARRRRARRAPSARAARRRAPPSARAGARTPRRRGRAARSGLPRQEPNRGIGSVWAIDRAVTNGRESPERGPRQQGRDSMDGEATAAVDVGTSEDARLESLGYKPQLNRVLGFFSNFAVAFTYLSPMVGIYSLFILGVGHRRARVHLADDHPAWSGCSSSPSSSASSRATIPWPARSSSTASSIGRSRLRLVRRLVLRDRAAR